MDLQAITAQLYMLHGEPQETEPAPGLLAQAPPSRAARGRDRDYLFIHLTLSGPADETMALAQDLQDAISERFYGTPGSVTAALRQAILDTNELLLRRNVSGVDVSREGALTCAVLRQQELYMAQVGESFAILGQNFGLERLPAAPPSRITPLGRTAGLDVRFYHNWLQPGHMLLLADPRMAHLPTNALRSAMLETAGLEESLVAFEALLAADTSRLMLLLFTDETIPMPRAPTSPSGGARLAPPTTVPRRDPRFLRQAPSAPGETVGAGRATPPDVRLPQVDLAPAAADASARAARGLGRFSGWLAELLLRLRGPGRGPQQPADSDAAEETAEAGGWAWPALVAVIIPLIIAAVGTAAYVQRGQVERFSALRLSMGQMIAQAQEAPDQATALALYQQAMAVGAEAETLRPGNGDIAALRIQAQSDMDRLESITRLAARTVYDFGEGARLRSVALREGFNGDVFVLDAGNNAAWRLDTAEDYVTLEADEAERLLTTDQAVGSHTVGTLIDMIWRSSGTNVSRENLAVLDAQGDVVSYFPDFGDYRSVPLGLASNWLQPRQITGFAERLYVLDPGAQLIWRYFPEGDGFNITEGQQSLDFVDPPDLGNVVDMAIYSEDGSVILLYGDGRLRRFVNGRILWSETDLTQGGLASPLVAPSALRLAGRGLNSSIFVADPGSARVVQFSLGGIFLAQYRAADENGLEAFADVTDLTVAEAPLRIIVTTGSQLVVAAEP